MNRNQVEASKHSAINYNSSPLVKLAIEPEGDGDDDYKEIDYETIKAINKKKKIVSKLVEIQIKTIYTFEDGSTKETIEKENHQFNY